MGVTGVPKLRDDLQEDGRGGTEDSLHELRHVLRQSCAQEPSALFMFLRGCAGGPEP